MYVDIPEFQRCCCCVPARYGLLVWTYIKLTLSIITLISTVTILYYSMMTYDFSELISKLFVLILIILGLVLDITIHIMALVGGHSKNLKLLSVYYYYSYVSLILFINAYTIFLIFIIYMVVLFKIYFVFIWHYILWYVVVGCASIAIQVYMLLLLRSKVHKLRNNCQFRFVNHAAEAEAECTMVIDQFLGTTQLTNVK